jgi:hypothetical protein
MKRVNSANVPIAKQFPFPWNQKEYKLDHWGEVDFYAYHDDILVLLEVERSQTHPNTNVLQLWPYLFYNNDVKVLLLHVFVEGGKSIKKKNRIKQGDFVAEQLVEMYVDRFRYCRFIYPFDKKLNVSGIAEKKILELI